MMMMMSLIKNQHLLIKMIRKMMLMMKLNPKIIPSQRS